MKTLVQASALALGLAAMVAGTLPADAATTPRHHVVARHQPALVPAPALPFGGHYGPDGVAYSAMGSPIPGYVLSTPEKCWVEEGYSQWGACDGD